MRKLMIVIAGILLLAMNANAATTFPVDEAGLIGYVKANDSIDIVQAMNAFNLPVQVLNETYIIGTIPGFSGKVYVGADGWIIPYYGKSILSSQLIEWGGYTSNPNISSVTSTTTLEYPIQKVSSVIGVNFSTIKPQIQYYNFNSPNATEMKVIMKFQYGAGTNEFNILIPSNKTIYESTFSHYFNRGIHNIAIDRASWIDPRYDQGVSIINYQFSRNQLHTVGVACWTEQYYRPTCNSAAIAWVLVI